MKTFRTFPLNAWYAAAWSHEVGRQHPVGRKVCDMRIVFWRKADGTITALEDACWHRLLPLSMGWLEGDEIVCRYHGLEPGSDPPGFFFAIRAGSTEPWGERHEW